ncbi:MAG: DegT/DnrJ/EryC1/StrS family aminotransferase [Thermoplasmatota archaeon]
MIPIANPIIGSEEKAAVAAVLDSGMIASGPKTKEFERAFADYVGTQHAVATTSGTTALHTGLLSLGVGSGDEIIVPSFSFIATANAVLFCGARPVFCDVDPDTFTIYISKIEDLITDKTKAIMPVHLYGQPADMKPLMEIAEKHELHVIGDACQAHGASYHGRMVGSFGDLECFSFYPTKNMTTGEGGMITTDSEAIAKLAYSLRNHGRTTTGGGYAHDKVGYNYRMTDIAAAIGLHQLERLPGLNEQRTQNASYLTERLEEFDGIQTPVVLDDVEHVYHQYTLRCDNRASIIDHLEENDIGYGIYYPQPLHMYPHLQCFAHADLEQSEQLAEQVISLPVHPSLSQRDIEMVAATVSEACRRPDI